MSIYINFITTITATTPVYQSNRANTSLVAVGVAVLVLVTIVLVVVVVIFSGMSRKSDRDDRGCSSSIR